MNSTDWPIAITAMDDFLTAGVRLWQHQQQLFATVAVKTTFTLVPGERMKHRAPLPIERVERPVGQAGGIEPGDLAPCLVQPEIWVRGHAWFPPAAGAPSVRVRLMIARDDRLILRKGVEIPIEGNAPPFVHALAPLSETWPVRTRLLGPTALFAIEGAPLAIPDVFDWSYFQAAPADQRLDSLRGDEWIRLEGIHPTIYRFDTRLPSAWSAVSLFGPEQPYSRGAPLQMNLDSIQIDADHGWCALVFRGHVAVPAGIRLDELQFVAGLGLPGKPIPTLTPPRPPVPHISLAATAVFDTHDMPMPHGSMPPTVVLDVHDLPATHTSGTETAVLDTARLQAAAAHAPLPFDDHPSRFPSSIPPSAPPPSSARRRDPLMETMQLDASAISAALHRQPLPFHRESPESPPATPDAAPIQPTPVPEKLADSPATPPIQSVAAPEPVAPAAPNPPQTLGESFLAAMKDAAPAEAPSGQV